MIRQAQDGKKLLAKRIEQIENTVVAENSGLSQQHKSANDKLKNKTKELKDASTEIKKLTDNEKILQEALNLKNRKIAELEITLATTQSILDHSKEVNNKKEATDKLKDEKPDESEKSKNAKPNSPVKTNKRCKYENTGTCSRQEGCRFVHPKVTCQSFSKIGSCQNEFRCEYRHPRTICNSWRTTRSCPGGDRCRERHPVEFSGPPPTYSEQKQVRRTSSQSYSQTPNFVQAQVRDCVPNQSFLEMGAAAACGPGHSHPSITMGCCQEPMYPQRPQSQHHHSHHTPPHLYQQHSPHHAWPQSGSPSQ